MVKKKYYAVRRGFMPGMYHSWDECKAQVIGCPDNEFKGFTNINEAEEYLRSFEKDNSRDEDVRVTQNNNEIKENPHSLPINIMKRKKKRFYAVRVGRNPGVYDTWRDCEDQVKGYPDNEFKGFRTFSEAQEYLMHQSSSIRSTKEVNEDLKVKEDNQYKLKRSSYIKRGKEYSKDYETTSMENIE